MRTDLRDAMRQLGKTHGFAATVLITLALGFGSHHRNLHAGETGDVEVAAGEVGIPKWILQGAPCLAAFARPGRDALPIASADS